MNAAIAHWLSPWAGVLPVIAVTVSHWLRERAARRRHEELMKTVKGGDG